MNGIKTISLALCLLANASLLDARIFTNKQGQEVDASVEKVDGEKVTLVLKKNGKSYDITLDSLSEADREYLVEWKKGEKGGKQEAVVKENFDAPWPDRISIDLDIEIKVIEEDVAKKSFVYHSPNYEFVSDVRLTKNVIKKFAVLFEATREYCRLLPIATMKAHVPGEQFRHKILLFETRAAYVENGGPPESGGVFIPRLAKGRGVVMVPFDSLGLKKLGSSYSYDYKGKNKVLPHEITHQLTDSEYFQVGARGWFSEGLSDYVAVTPYRSGKFFVRTNLSEIKDYVTAYGEDGRGGRALGKEINAPNLKDYMLQPYSSFTGENGGFNYGFALLLTYYYFQMEEDTSNIKAFLKALKNGKKGEEALDVLLNGRSWDEMEAQISKAWKSRGVRIHFN